MGGGGGLGGGGGGVGSIDELTLELCQQQQQQQHQQQMMQLQQQQIQQQQLAELEMSTVAAYLQDFDPVMAGFINPNAVFLQQDGNVSIYSNLSSQYICFCDAIINSIIIP